VVRWGWAAIMLCSLLVLPGLAQDECDAAEPEEAPPAWVKPGEALTDLPAEPTQAIAPDGTTVLDFKPPLPEAGQPCALARAILARPEFQHEVDVPQENLLERFERWLSSLPGLPRLGPHNWLALNLLVVVVGLLAYLIVRIAWGSLSRRRRGETVARRNGRGGGRSVDYLDEAEQAALRREYREAVRFRFLAVLQQAGLPDNQLLTNRQVKRQLVERNRLVERPLVELITGYEDSWYGQLPCSEEMYSGLRLWAEQIERLLLQQQEQAA
jgi:hypothetical protein